MSRRLICGGDMDAGPATLEPSRGLIHAMAASDGAAPARDAATAAASLRLRDDALGGELNTSSSSADVTSTFSVSRVAILPQLLC